MTAGILLNNAVVMFRCCVLSIATVIAGCSGRPSDRRLGRTVDPPATDSISLDSCASLDRLGRPQGRVLAPGETVPAPRAGSWTAVKPLSVGAFQIAIPTVTTVSRPDSMSIAVFDFPNCRYFCAINITLVHDSTHRSLDDYVTSLRAVDTTGDPDAARDRPGLPRPIRIGPDRAFAMDVPCGDCTVVDVVVKRSNTIAHLSSSIDDGEGYQPGLMCRLTRVAATFQWLDPNAAISSLNSRRDR